MKKNMNAQFRHVTKKLSAVAIPAGGSIHDNETLRPEVERSELLSKLSEIDFFDEVIVLGPGGSLLASLGQRVDALVTLARRLVDLDNAVPETLKGGALLGCEVALGTETLFGVASNGHFALLSPTRQEMTPARIDAVAVLLGSIQ